MRLYSAVMLCLVSLPLLSGCAPQGLSEARARNAAEEWATAAAAEGSKHHFGESRNWHYTIQVGTLQQDSEFKYHAEATLLRDWESKNGATWEPGHATHSVTLTYQKSANGTWVMNPGGDWSPREWPVK